MAGEISRSITQRLRSTETTLDRTIPTVRQTIDQTTAGTAAGTLIVTTDVGKIGFQESTVPGLLYLHNIDPSTTVAPRISWGINVGSSIATRTVGHILPREADSFRMCSSQVSSNFGFQTTAGATAKLEYELWHK